MRNFKNILFSVASFLFIFFAFNFVLINKTEAASQCTATVTGDWSNPATWGGTCGGAGGIPDLSYGVIISTGAVVTVDITLAEAASIQINNTTGVATGITISGLNVLSVGSIAIQAPGADGNSTINVGNGTLVGTSLVVYGDTGLKISEVIVNNGTINVNMGDVILLGTAENARLTSTGSSTINLKGSIVGGILTTSGDLDEVINFNGSVAQFMGAYTYNNVKINNTSGGVTLNGDVTIGRNLTINQGTLDVGANTFQVDGATTIIDLDGVGSGNAGGRLTFSSATGTKTFIGDVIIRAGGTWNETVALGGPVINFAGSFQNNGTVNKGRGTHTFSGADKTISGGAGIMISNLNITGTITNNNSAYLAVDTLLTGSGRLTNGVTGVLTIIGTFNIVQFDASTAGNSVVYYSNNQDVRTDTDYYDLIFATSGTKTVASAIPIANNFVIDTGVTANLTGISTARSLYFGATVGVGGVLQAEGTWGSSSSFPPPTNPPNNTYFSGTGLIYIGTITPPTLIEPTIISESTVKASSGEKVVGAFAVTETNGVSDTIDGFTIENKVGLTAVSADIASVAIYSDTGTLGIIDGSDAVACIEATTNTTTNFDAGGSVITFTCSSPIVIGVNATKNYLVVITTTSGATNGRTMAAKINVHLSAGDWATQDLETTNSITIDIEAPTVTITSSPSINDANKASYTVSGTCSEDARTVYVDIGGVSANPTCTILAWTTGAIDVSAAADSATLPITANHTDDAGNNAEATASVIKDTLAPTLLTANPVAGTYTSTQSVSLTAEGDNNIQYSFNDDLTNCASGTSYSTPISIAASATIYALACDTAGNSLAASFPYVISIPTTSHGSSGSYVRPPTIVPPVVCLPGQLFNPIDGKPCPKIITTPAPIFTRTLKYKMIGDDVKALQVFLNNHGYPVAIYPKLGSKGNETNLFGALTRNAVIKFQLANGLKGDGIMGPRTLEIIKNMLR